MEGGRYHREGEAGSPADRQKRLLPESMSFGGGGFGGGGGATSAPPGGAPAPAAGLSARPRRNRPAPSAPAAGAGAPAAGALARAGGAFGAPV